MPLTKTKHQCLSRRRTVVEKNSFFEAGLTCSPDLQCCIGGRASLARTNINATYRLSELDITLVKSGVTASLPEQDTSLLR